MKFTAAEIRRINDITLLCDLTRAIEAIELARSNAHRALLSAPCAKALTRERDRLRKRRDEVVIRLRALPEQERCR